MLTFTYVVSTPDQAGAEVVITISQDQSASILVQMSGALTVTKTIQGIDGINALCNAVTFLREYFNRMEAKDCHLLVDGIVRPEDDKLQDTWTTDL